MVTASSPFQTQNDELEKQQQGQAAAGSAAPSVSSGQSANVSTGSAAPATVGGAAPSGPTSSGRYNNLQAYMNANKDFNNGEGLAGKVASNITGASDQVQQNAQIAQNSFNQQAQQNVGQWNNLGVVNQAVADPAKFAQDPNNIAQVAKVRDAEYTGPKSFRDLQGQNNYANLQVGLNNAQDMASQAQNESGRFNLLRQMFGNGNYSQGQQNLDNLLVSSNPDQARKLNATRQTVNQAAQNLNELDTSAAQQANLFSNQANTVRTQARGALNNAAVSADQAIAQKVADEKAKQKSILDNASTGFNAGRFSKADAAALGIKSGDALYDLNPGDYLKTRIDPAAQTVASADDYAKFSALQKLIGGTASADASKALATYADPSKAGAYYKDPIYGFDKDAFQTALAAKAAQYNEATAGDRNVESFDKSQLDGEKGYNQYLKNMAQSYRTYLGQNSPDLYKDLQGLSDEDIIQKYADQVAPNLPHDVVRGGGYEGLGAAQQDIATLNAALMRRKELSETQDRLAKLRALYKADRTVQVPDISVNPLQG